MMGMVRSDRIGKYDRTIALILCCLFLASLVIIIGYMAVPDRRDDAK